MNIQWDNSFSYSNSGVAVSLYIHINCCHAEDRTENKIGKMPSLWRCIFPWEETWENRHQANKETRSFQTVVNAMNVVADRLVLWVSQRETLSWDLTDGSHQLYEAEGGAFQSGSGYEVNKFKVSEMETTCFHQRTEMSPGWGWYGQRIKEKEYTRHFLCAWHRVSLLRW